MEEEEEEDEEKDDDEEERGNQWIAGREAAAQLSKAFRSPNVLVMIFIPYDTCGWSWRIPT